MPARPEPALLTLPHWDPQEQLRDRRFSTIVKLLFMVALCVPAFHIAWTAPPRTTEFQRAMRNYDQVANQMSLAEVEELLGPASGRPEVRPRDPQLLRDPELAQADERICNQLDQKRFPTATDWKKWQAAGDEERWIAICFCRGVVVYKTKRGF